jgi:Fe-S-cluster containining protein
VSYPRIDLDALAGAEGVDFGDVHEALLRLYLQVDRRIAAHTADVNLPCQEGCDACCHESVFLTPLEFYGVWAWVQDELDDATRYQVVQHGLALYEKNRELIEALNHPPPPGSSDHLVIARKIRFRCPLLDSHGACRVYPVRELYARLFGCSFNEDRGIYGCERVGEYLAGREITLFSVRAVAEQLDDLPLTNKRQVYPYYIAQLYGKSGPRRKVLT